MPRRLLHCLSATLLLFISLELIARFNLGLGDPPLSQPHPTIEYLFKPNQDVRRFGKHFRTNRYSMRSDDFPPRKPGRDELRVMVYGDSVVNGGALTDQSRLATTLLQQHLSQLLHRPVVVGNISAGSWGPPNQLAYARQFGFFDADVVVLVQSSHDYGDMPTFAPLDASTHPTREPWSAAWEGLTRYLPRYLSWREGVPAESAPPADPRAIEVSLAAEREFLRVAVASGAKAILVQHWTASELSRREPDAGHTALRQIAVALGVPVHDDADAFRRYQSRGLDPFRDDIHPNDAGQAALEEVLLSALKSGVIWP